VVKNVAGYDFPKLLTGSMGTLGVTCEVTLKVRPRPEDSALIVVPFFEKLDDLAQALTRLNTSATRPVAVDILNRTAADWVLRDAAPPATWSLIVGFEEATSTVTWQIDQLRAEVADRAPAVTVLRGAETGPFWSALSEFQATGPGPIKLRAGLPPSLLSPLIGAIDPATWALQAHAGTGTIHFQTVPDVELEQLAPRVERLRAACVKAGGHLVVTSCPTQAKGRLKVWGDPRPDWTIGAKVKAALDPAGALNPGRFVGTI
jgi:glycolate oxidase FAD binding subunit